MVSKTSDSRKILLELLKCETSEEIKNLVEKNIFFKSVKWFPYGGFPNNTGVVEGQMREPENALIEKITNSIDAILMRKCLEEGINPVDQEQAPKNMEDALQRYYGGRDKLREKRSEFAKKMIRVSAIGGRQRPTLTIIDKGEGQTPSSVPNTILSLQKEIKKKIRFVYGTYNQGGSSALSFCGDPQQPTNYIQLVLCKRAQTVDGENSNFGFTLVRTRFDEDSGTHTYEYFVDKNKNIPCSYSKSILINGHNFLEGCLIRLYDYHLSNPGNIVFRGLNESIEKKLAYSPLPLFLQELRSGYRGDIEYTIFGFREKMERLPKKVMYPGFPSGYPVDLGDIGKKTIRLFVLRHKSQHKENIDSYLEQKEKVFFLRNGMTLHTEYASWLREYCGLTDLAPYMFLFIDISEINPVLARMLHSGRESFRNNQATKLTLERLKIFLESFKDLDREYGSLTATDISVEDKDLKRQLAREVAKDPELKKLFDLGDDFPIKEEKGVKEVPYEGEYLPTKFELIGPEQRFIEKRTYAKISFRTEATDDLFQRFKDKGKHDWSESENFFIAFNGIKRGVVRFRIDVKAGAKVGSSSSITFFLKVPSKNLEFSQEVRFEIIDTPEYKGEYFPSYFKPTKKILKIPVGAERKLVLATDVEDNYLTRTKDRGRLELPSIKNLEFGNFKLSNGFLIIKVKYTGNKIEEVHDIRLKIYDQADHRFDVSIPVEIVPPDYDPNLRLPELKHITREDWENETPKFAIENIARIPNWTKFDIIKINLDSMAFEELNSLSLSNRDRARDFLIKQIYLASIWLYLELRDLSPSNNDYDVKSESFDRAMRGTIKLLLNNIKKLIR